MRNFSWGFSHLKSALLPPLVAILGGTGAWHGNATAGPVLERIAARGEVVLGYRASATPFSYASAPGVPAGYAVDLCGKMVETLRKAIRQPGLRVRYAEIDTRSRFTALRDGSIDIECAGTTNTRERRETMGMAFTIAHYIAGVRMLVHRDSGIEKLEDLRGKSLLVARGTSAVGVVRRKVQQFNASIVECEDAPQCLQAVVGRKGDAYLNDDILLYGMRSQLPAPDGYRVVGKFLSVEPLSLMFSDADPAFKRLIDQEMHRLIQSRELHALYRKWFESPIPPNGRNLGIPMNYLLRDSLAFPTDKIGN